jgi:branched-chain amino acid transport system ATP-binding protein
MRERVYQLLPLRAVRRGNLGNLLSGREQQMLAIGCALMGNPALLLDEPLEGLAPVIVDTLLAAMHQLRQDDGMTIILVEQHARLALEFAPHVVVLDRVRTVYDGKSQPLLDEPQRLAELIGVGWYRHRHPREKRGHCPNVHCCLSELQLSRE